MKENIMPILDCLLSSLKIDVNQCMSEGSTSLMLAIEKNNVDIVKKLVKRPDIKVNLVRYDGLNALKNLCTNSIILLYKYALKCDQLESRKKIAIEIFSLLEKFVSISDDAIKIKLLDMRSDPFKLTMDSTLFYSIENYYRNLINLVEYEVNKALESTTKFVFNTFN